MQRGERIRDHVLLEKIGDGGMGEVWTAEHTQIKRVDAIKFLRDIAGLQKEAKDRFLNEARVQGQMHHQNIVAVSGAFEEHGASCIVMQYVDGGSLEQRLHRNPAQLLPLAEVVKISTDVLSALAYSHSFLPIGYPPELAGVVHRDVKPSNILLDRSGRALLTDFGIAFATGGHRITTLGMTLGTVFYMSPEQIQDPSKVDLRSDIYSFGCVLYELLAGRPPFGAESDTDFTIKTQHIRDMPTPIRSLNPQVPFDFEWIVYKALNKDPAVRFQSCAEMSRALSNAFAAHTAGGEGAGVRKPTGPQAVETPPGYVSPVTSRTATVIQPVPSTGGTPLYPPESLPIAVPAVVPGPVVQVPVEPVRKRGPLVWIGVAVVLLLLLGGAGYFFWDKLFGPSEEIILTMKGSTSIGDELAPKMAEAYLRDQLKATRTGQDVIKKDADGHVDLHVWGDVPDKGRQVIDIYATKSGDAFKCLASTATEQRCDIGMSSRPVKPGDRGDNAGLPDLSGQKNEHVIALDGIAVVVNPSNQVTELSISQLRGIYTGQIRNWSQVGGADAAIELFGRQDGSGTKDMFEQMVLGKGAVAAVTEDHKKAESADVVTAVMGSQNGIGYVSSPLTKDTKALAITDGGTALKPTELAVVSEDYPISRRLFLYGLNGASSTTTAFIQYAVSDKGQGVVVDANYAGLTPRAFDVEVPQGAPAEYERIAAGYRRLGMSFRFASGKSSGGDETLDNLARDNVSRLEAYLAKHPDATSSFILVGYADNVGGPGPNMPLGLKRAQSVASSLESGDIHVSAMRLFSLGLQMPVATNDTPEGKARNRRVEVWIKKGTD